jgi:hypothetical protein
MSIMSSENLRLECSGIIRHQSAGLPLASWRQLIKSLCGVNTMKRLVAAALVLAATAASLEAQQPPEFPKPQKEHEWLNQFVGEWEGESECTPVAGQPPVKGRMREKVRSLGGFWIVSDGDAEMMGTKMNVVLTIGYSPEKKKYVGTWVDSMQSHIWHYEGTVDPTGKIITLEADGPCMTTPGKTCRYRDVTEFRTPDERVFTSYVQDDKGEWTKLTSGISKRRK